MNSECRSNAEKAKESVNGYSDQLVSSKGEEFTDYS